MPSDKHLSYEALADFVEGRADARADAQARTHLATGCAICETERARLARTFAALQGRDLAPAPLAATERARRLFRERLDLSPARGGTTAKPRVSPTGLLARLIFDSRRLSGASPAAARSDALPSFNPLFSADGYDIDLWQEPQTVGGDNWHIIGQALPTEGDDATTASGGVTGAILTPLGGGGDVVEATFPASGEFHFDSVAPGRYDLRLMFGENAAITLSDVPVGR